MSGCLAVILCIFFPQLIPFVIIYYLACLVEEVSTEKKQKVKNFGLQFKL